MKLLKPDEQNRAVSLLKNGELIGLPTETVYGLAGDARNPAAIKKIFALKHRPANHPVIVHIANSEQLSDWAIDIPESARTLSAHFWPGPLTFILKKAAHVCTQITGGKNTIGLRAPSHPIAQQILSAFGSGLAAPSANQFCRLSPTCEADVEAEFGQKIPYVVPGGACCVGLESTILDLTQATPRILRPGMISAQEIEQCLKQPVLSANNHDVAVPGNLPRHYAPSIPASLTSLTTLEHLATQPHIGIISHHPSPQECVATWINLSDDVNQYAQKLYHTLRTLEQQCREIYIEQPPNTAPWFAILDRLKRMTHRRAS
jgi:L-threonylcarbamoyladenylate synthase